MEVVYLEFGLSRFRKYINILGLDGLIFIIVVLMFDRGWFMVY